MNQVAGNSVLFGRFYPEYDIAVSLLWVFIILSGLGNWVVMWLTLRTKSLRNPFNMIVLALSFANGVGTTVVGPMSLIRILMAYNRVTVHWCNARILLQTFCISVSIMIIFTLSAMRLTAGLMTTPKKLTYKKMVGIIVFIYCLAIITAPVFLDKTTVTYRSCLGNLHTDTLKIILQNEGLLSIEDRAVDNLTENQAHNNTQSASSDDIQWALVVTGTVTTATTSDVSEITAKPWIYYLVMTIILFIGTVICYIALIIILKRRKNAVKSMVLGNSKDILTMRVTAYVTCTFLISFLVPFFPGLVRLHPQSTAATFHYVSIFYCLSYLDGALTPIIIYFSNSGYRKALLKALPHWIKRCFCNSIQIAPAPSPLPSPNTVALPVVTLSVPLPGVSQLTTS